MSPADFRVELHDQGGSTPARPRTRHRAPLRRRTSDAAGQEPQAPTEPRTGRHGAERKAGQGDQGAQGARPAKAAPADKPTPRAGTKQAR